MCGSNGFHGGACCPQAQIFQEKLCGNFNNTTDEEITLIAWQVPEGVTDYIQGTFEIFNSNVSADAVEGVVTSANDEIEVPEIVADPGNSAAVSVSRPTAFEITVGPGESGTYCITLYKRVLP